MTITRIIIIFGIVLVLFAGFVFYQFNSQNIKQAFHTLQKTDVTIDNHTFHAEVAKAQADQEIGLSDRKSLAQDGGMLFVFDKPGNHSFWMHNMDFPVDIIFIHNDKIAAIYNNLIPLPTGQVGQVYGADVVSDRVLEINSGLAKKYFFNVGDTVKTGL
jgi:uncharacterized membrane protein (UPF0127 family)